MPRLYWLEATGSQSLYQPESVRQLCQTLPLKLGTHFFSQYPSQLCPHVSRPAWHITTTLPLLHSRHKNSTHPPIILLVSLASYSKGFITALAPLFYVSQHNKDLFHT